MDTIIENNVLAMCEDGNVEKQEDMNPPLQDSVPETQMEVDTSLEQQIENPEVINNGETVPEANIPQYNVDPSIIQDCTPMEVAETVPVSEQMIDTPDTSFQEGTETHSNAKHALDELTAAVSEHVKALQEPIEFNTEMSEESQEETEIQENVQASKEIIGAIEEFAEDIKKHSEMEDSTENVQIIQQDMQDPIQEQQQTYLDDQDGTILHREAVETQAQSVDEMQEIQAIEEQVVQHEEANIIEAPMISTSESDHIIEQEHVVSTQIDDHHEIVQSHVEAEEVILGDPTEEENHSAEEEQGIEEEVKIEMHMKRKKNDLQQVQSILEAQQGQSGTVVVVTSADDPKEIVLRTADGQEIHDIHVQQVTDESGQIYLLETMENVIVMESEENSDGVEFLEMQRTKTLPSHVMGRNIENPSVDPFRNGKAPPKPRLGVKIPYRNLTSQIVSKQEIADEILERSRRNSKDNPTGQNLFARKLTQTLAKKLAPPKTNNPKSAPKEHKLNNSDLIAILEGHGDPDTPEPVNAETQKEVAAVPMTKELEREIALKQLSELPDDPPEAAKPPVKVENKYKPPASPPQRQEEKSPKSKVNDEEVVDEDPKPSRFSSVPLKTYTRKRKPSEEVQAYIEKSPTANKVHSNETNSTKKIDLPANTNNYMTKSSRIIKKKVIWDPDEVPPRKLMKACESGSKSPATPARAEKKESPTEKREPLRTDKQNTIHQSGKVEKKAESPRTERKSDAPVRIYKIDKKNEVKAPEVKKVDKVDPKRIPVKPKTEVKPEIKKLPEKTKEVKKDIEPKSPADKTTVLKNKKRLSEVDKLLMDEGAVNMLYSIKDIDEDQSHKKKPNKSLMSKTNELLNDLQTSSDKVSPKALRKKESTPTGIPAAKAPKNPVVAPPPLPPPTPSSIVARQKSRDSNRSSLHSPPPSPGLICGADASRIIRRHSSSSFSSADENNEESDKPKVKKADARGTRRKMETPTDNPKKKFKQDQDTPATKEQLNDEKSKEFNKLIDAAEPVSKYEKYKSFSVGRRNHLYEISIASNKNKEMILNIETMQELCSILKDLETECDCNVVLVTSDGDSFCNGLNYKPLIVGKDNTRKNVAKKLATNVRDFLLSLANFPKVLVAAVHGNVEGLGVTMLPLFDMVIADENSTFHTPYSNLGCIAEGGSLLCLSHLSQNVLVSELLFRSQKMSSSDAMKLGLVTRSIPSVEYQHELLASLKSIASQSSQFMESTKKQVRQRMIPEITASLNSETETLVQQWIGAECQKNFTNKYSN